MAKKGRLSAKERRRQLARAKNESKKLRAARLEELARMQRFFGVARVPCDLTSGDYVKVNGQTALRLRTLDHGMESVVDMVAAVCCSEQLVEALTRNMATPGMTAYYDRDFHGFRLDRNNEAIAVVRASSAGVIGAAVQISANFLVDGPHWRTFANELAKALQVQDAEQANSAHDASESEDLSPATVPQARSSLTALLNAPDGLDEELAGACMEASRAIRLERRRAYSHPVVLRQGAMNLRVSPIKLTPSRLQLPFRYISGDGDIDVAGWIDLRSAHDPVTVWIDAETAHGIEAQVWATALLGYAAIACFEMDVPGDRSTTRAPSRPGRYTLNPTRSGTRTRTRTLPPPSPAWPRHLRPTGLWAAHGASFVAGHIRRLYDGRTASPEARTRALGLGITLNRNQTWVRPHARGLPEEAELEFDWSAPLISRMTLRG